MLNVRAYEISVKVLADFNKKFNRDLNPDYFNRIVSAQNKAVLLSMERGDTIYLKYIGKFYPSFNLARKKGVASRGIDRFSKQRKNYPKLEIRPTRLQIPYTVLQ